MKRNYLPPSIQSAHSVYHGYQSQEKATTSQGSITAGTPNMSRDLIKPPKMTLETIPQGSIMETQNFPSQSSNIVSPFTPSSGQFSPTHGAVAQVQGSITSGTPIVCHQNPNSTPQISPPNTNFGSITSGTPTFPSASSFQGSITSGTPIVQNQFTSGIPVNQGCSNIPTNYKGSITSGVPQGQQFAPVQYSGSINNAQGPVVSGAPMLAQQYPPNNVYANRPQRKYSGPQRIKLQMLATVQEMGKYFLLFHFGGGDLV